MRRPTYHVEGRIICPCLGGDILICQTVVSTCFLEFGKYNILHDLLYIIIIIIIIIIILVSVCTNSVSKISRLGWHLLHLLHNRFVLFLQKCHASAKSPFWRLNSFSRFLLQLNKNREEECWNQRCTAII